MTVSDVITSAFDFDLPHRYCKKLKLGSSYFCCDGILIRRRINRVDISSELFYEHESVSCSQIPNQITASYGSGSDQMMRLLAAPDPQHCVTLRILTTSVIYANFFSDSHH
jgi:hypothetical protein